jgi:hypothetical protein
LGVAPLLTVVRARLRTQFREFEIRFRLLGVFEIEGKLLDDRVGEHVASDALHLRAGGSGVQVTSKFNHEIFALADVFNPLISHLLECVVDGLSLGIKNGLLEGYVDMSLHRARL